MTREKVRLGSIFKNKTGENFIIVEYFDNSNVSVKFEDGTVIKNREYKECKLGTIKNPMTPLILDIGYFGQGIYLSRDKITREKTPYYKLWMNMLQRCYNPKFTERNQTYKDVTVCEEWCNFQNFAKWFEENYNPETMQGWHLDKDLLGNSKIYSPNTCCFLPKSINLYIIKTKSGKLPQGIRLTPSGNYQVRVTFKKVEKCLGRYVDIDEAIFIYNTEKEYNIRLLAEEWKEQLAKKVYQALTNYKI